MSTMLSHLEGLAQELGVEIRYEDLLTNPRKTLENIFSGLEIEVSDNYFKNAPKLKTGNFNKWKKEFADDDIRQIRPIIAPLISQLGYDTTAGW